MVGAALDAFRPFHESSVVRAETVAAMIGAAAVGRPGPVSGMIALQAAAFRREAEVRAKFGMALIGLAASPDPLAVFGAPFAPLPKTTLDQVRTQLLAKVKTELIAGNRNLPSKTPAGLVASDLYDIRGEVMKLGREKGKDAVEKYIADVVKERGLEHGMTAEPRDQYHLGDDPGVGPAQGGRTGRPTGRATCSCAGSARRSFADLTREADAPDGPFIPHKYVATGLPDEKQFYWWRTEDVPPKTPKFETAKKEVVEPWKLMQARDLAKKEAERVLEAVKKSPREAPNLRDIALQNGNREYFELGPIALYMPQLPSPDRRPGPGVRHRRGCSRRRPRTSWPRSIKSRPIGSHIRMPTWSRTCSTSEKIRRARRRSSATSRSRTTMSRRCCSGEEPHQDEFRRAYRGSMARAASPIRDQLLATWVDGTRGIP